MNKRPNYEDFVKIMPFLGPMGDFFMIFHPDQISVTSFVFALLGGAALIFDAKFLLLAFVFWVFSSFLDCFDGYVARKSGKASKYGDFLDHTLDRFADVVMFLSVTYSPYVAHKNFGFLAIISVLLVSYLGEEGVVYGAGREIISPCNRAARLIIGGIAFLIVFILQILSIRYIYQNFTLFDALMAIYIVLAIITIIIRFNIISKEIKGSAQKKDH